MSEFYGAEQRHLQDAYDTRQLADRVQQIIVVDEIGEEHRAFIESRDFFFLTTVDHRGYPTCSHKGGNPGLVRVVDNKTLAFPSYDGNGMYLSMGNLRGNPKIGLLFIDFETPHRVRVHGDASIADDDPLLAEYPGAEMIVRVALREIFINCPRYIHRMTRVETSRYVPQAGCETPAPQWKRIDAVQDVLPPRDRAIAEKLGGTITPEEYGELVLKGQG